MEPLAMRVGMLLSMVFLCGCVYVPPVWDAGDEVYHLDFIEPGVTTKVQVLAELGEPDRSQEMDDGTSYWYWWGNKSEGAMAALIPPTAVLFGLVEDSTWVVRIEFDQNDVVRKFRTSTATEPISVPVTFPTSQTEPTQYFSMQLKKACADDKLAQFVVGKSYDIGGEVIEQDKVEAFKWYSLAAPEWPDAIKFKDRLRQHMTLVEIAEAERRVAEWRPGNCEAEPARTRRGRASP